MRAVGKRIGRLESRFWIVDGKQQRNLAVVCNVGWGLALDEDRCIQILEECGRLPAGAGFALVDLGKIPDDLNAEELERYLRENGAAMRSPR